MDFDDPKANAVFFDIHSGLPREGPGNRESTRRALDLARPLPDRPTVLDIACGPGMQTMDLAELMPDARITAVDNHPPFVEEANRRAAAGGVTDRVRAELGDMSSLDFTPGSFDLLWCEGAAYIMGVGAALRAWRPLLRHGGRLALTEAVWLREDPPDTVRRCWDEYPGIGDIAACRTLVRECGYELLGDFVLPEAAWWDDYYTPMARRLERLAPRYAGDPVAQAVLDESREEIAVYRDHAAYYGYVFLVMARPSSDA
ncbi:MAG: class I SAM-dependent methyltransferase [Inquilinus sp.]|nr:class I SAM-dependent methyltransferase [Inquilinus sp.]